MARRKRWILMSTASLALAGCSTFTGSRKLDMTPFAENTTTMIGEFQRYSRPPTWVYLKEYQHRPSVEALRQAAKPLQAMMSGVALYSMQVASLHESRLPEKRRAKELARYIVEVVRPGIAAGYAVDIGITLEELDAIVGEIRKKETLLEAIAAAQPLVNAVIVSANRHFENVDTLITAAAADLNSVIDEKYAPLLENLQDVENVQMRTVRSFALLSRLRLGEQDALERLLANDPDMRTVLPAGKRPGPAELDAAEQRLVNQLARIQAVRDQLAPEFAVYKESQRELEVLRTRTEDQFRWGRAALGLWARSHRNLGAGIPVPPSVDILGLLREAGGSAAKKVIPL